MTLIWRRVILRAWGRGLALLFRDNCSWRTVSWSQCAASQVFVYNVVTHLVLPQFYKYGAIPFLLKEKRFYSFCFWFRYN